MRLACDKAGTTDTQRWRRQFSVAPSARNGSHKGAAFHDQEGGMLQTPCCGCTVTAQTRSCYCASRQLILLQPGHFAKAYRAVEAAVFSKTQYPDIRGSACSHAREPSTVLGARRRRIQSELSLQQTALAAGSKGV